MKKMRPETGYQYLEESNDRFKESSDKNDSILPEYSKEPAKLQAGSCLIHYLKLLPIPVIAALLISVAFLSYSSYTPSKLESPLIWTLLVSLVLSVILAQADKLLQGKRFLVSLLSSFSYIAFLFLTLLSLSQFNIEMDLVSFSDNIGDVLLYAFFAAIFVILIVHLLLYLFKLNIRGPSYLLNAVSVLVLVSFSLSFLRETSLGVLLNVASLMGLVTFSFLEELFFKKISLGLLLILIHSLIYYFKSSKQYSFYSIFLTLLTSLVFAQTITFIFLLIYAHGIPSLGVPVPFLNLILSPLMAAFVLSYLFISTKLLQKVLGNFDHDVFFFRSEKFPFSITNFMSSKERNFSKSIIKLTAASLVAYLVISSVIIAIMGILFVDQWASFSEDWNLGSEPFYYNSYYDLRFENIVEVIKGYDNSYTWGVGKKDGTLLLYRQAVVDHEGNILHYAGKALGEIKTNTALPSIELNHSTLSLGEAKTVFFNCDKNLECQEKYFDQRSGLGNSNSFRRS